MTPGPEAVHDVAARALAALAKLEPEHDWPIAGAVGLLGALAARVALECMTRATLGRLAGPTASGLLRECAKLLTMAAEAVERVPGPGAEA